jgi:hypothetical protein
MFAIGTQKRKTGEVEHLFFDALKLRESANPNFSIAEIPESVLSWGSDKQPAPADPFHMVDNT